MTQHRQLNLQVKPRISIFEPHRHNPNTPALAEGPEISIKPVGIRRVSAGKADTRDG
jgi:hypothetical protein